MDQPSDAESMVLVVMVFPSEDAPVRLIVFERHVPVVLASFRVLSPLGPAPHIEPVSEAMPSILARLRSLVPLEPAAPAEPIPEAMLVPCEPSDQCSICLEGAGASWIALSRCHHRFHAHCIRQWLRTTCPMCREEYAAT